MSWNDKSGTSCRVIHASAAYQSLSSIKMDSAILNGFLQALAKSLRHSVALSVLLAAELQQIRRDAVISTSKILTDTSKDILRKIPLVSATLFGGKIKDIYKENSEATQNKFIANAANAQKPKASLQTSRFQRSPSLTRSLLILLGKRQEEVIEVLVQAQAQEGEVDSPPSEEPQGQRNIDVSLPLPCTQSNPLVRARLGHFADCWGKTTDNQWVLSIVEQGYRIPFETKPPLSPTPILFQQSNRPALEEEVQKLLEKRAVEQINPEGMDYYSGIFLVPKKNGKR